MQFLKKKKITLKITLAGDHVGEPEDEAPLVTECSQSKTCPTSTRRFVKNVRKPNPKLKQDVTKNQVGSASRRTALELLLTQLKWLLLPASQPYPVSRWPTFPPRPPELVPAQLPTSTHAMLPSLMVAFLDFYQFLRKPVLSQYHGVSMASQLSILAFKSPSSMWPSLMAPSKEVPVSI